MIVVDTNVISYLYLSGERSHQAEKALAIDSQWAAPLLWRNEFSNILTTYLRKRILTLEDAEQIMNAATDLLAGREFVVPSSILRLAAASTCSTYDCEFVALAQDLNLPLVTVDRDILHQFPAIAVSLDHFIASCQ